MSDITDAADRLEAALDPDKRDGWTRLQDGDDGASEIDDLRTVLRAAREVQAVRVIIEEMQTRHQRLGRPHIASCTCGKVICPDMVLLEKA